MFTPRKLYFVMEQNRGGVHDAWARAEIERRQNEQLGCFLEQVGKHVETLGRFWLAGDTKRQSRHEQEFAMDRSPRP